MKLKILIVEDDLLLAEAVSDYFEGKGWEAEQVHDGMTAVDFTGTRYDMGNKLGILQATVEVALNHPEVGDSFRAYLKELSKTL